MLIDIPLDYWTVIVGTILPMLVALVRARFADSRVGAALLLLLSIIGGLLGEIVVDDGVASLDVYEIAKRALLMFVVAWCADYMALRKLKITGDAGVIEKTVPAGIGGPSLPPA